MLILSGHQCLDIFYKVLNPKHTDNVLKTKRYHLHNFYPLYLVMLNIDKLHNKLNLFSYLVIET